MPLHADSSGVLNGSFMIPPNVPTGSKLVNFRGSGGSQGQALYVANGVIDTVQLQRVHTTIVSAGVDPLAETFMLSEDRILAAVDLKFCAKGSDSNPVFVQIRDTSSGVPGTNVLAEGVVEGSSIVLPNVAPAPNAATLAPSQWTWIDSLHPTTNQFADTFIQVVGGTLPGQLTRGLLQFNLPKDLAGATVLSAVLRVDKDSGVTNDAFPISVHRLTQAWDNTATWNNAAGVTGWTAAGGQFATASGTDPVYTFPEGTDVSHDFNVTAIVQQWASGAPNFGVIIKDDTQANPGGTVKISKAIYPKLIITYQLPTPPPNVTENWTRFTFTRPVSLVANTYYAIVVLTDDPVHAVAISELGQYVKAGDGPTEGWVTQQPYNIGELLTSSNALTWTTNPTMDLCFRLLGCLFNATTATIDYGDIAVTNLSDIIPQVGVIRPSPDAQCNFQFTSAADPTDVMTGAEDEGIKRTALITDTLHCKALLSGTSKMSPIVLENFQVLAGTIGTTGTYFSDAIPADDNFDAILTFEVYKPAGADCAPYIAIQHMVSGVPALDGDGNYIVDYVALTKTSNALVADGWMSETWEIDGQRGVGLDFTTAVKLILSGSVSARGAVRNMRLIIK